MVRAGAHVRDWVLGALCMEYEMKDFERKGYSQYGASMGRRSSGKLEGKVSLVRVRLDSGGYDKGGGYWGTGTPLWFAEDAEGNSTYFRSDSRESAKDKLIKEHSLITSFYR